MWEYANKVFGFFLRISEEAVERLKKKKIELQVTERFRDRVVDEGYNPSYGARPLRIQPE